MAINISWCLVLVVALIGAICLLERFIFGHIKTQSEDIERDVFDGMTLEEWVSKKEITEHE